MFEFENVIKLLGCGICFCSTLYFPHTSVIVVVSLRVGSGKTWKVRASSEIGGKGKDSWTQVREWEFSADLVVFVFICERGFLVCVCFVCFRRAFVGCLQNVTFI